VDDDDIRIRDAGLEIKTGTVGNGLQLRIGRSEGRERARAVIRQEIGYAPAIAGLKRHHVMAELDKLPEYPAKKMSISVIPA
jgi:ribosomal protein S6E (S10)